SPLGDRLIPGLGDGAARIIGAVARDVDDPTLGLPFRTRKMRHREIDRGADRGPPHERARRREDRRGPAAGVLLVADLGPIYDHLLVLVPRPLDEAHLDCRTRTAMNGLE